MEKNNVVGLAGRDAIANPFSDLLRASAEPLIHQALEVGLQELLVEPVERREEDGKAGAVRKI